jgi:hypothetical protein
MREPCSHSASVQGPLPAVLVEMKSLRSSGVLPPFSSTKAGSMTPSTAGLERITGHAAYGNLSVMRTVRSSTTSVLS